MIFGKSSALLVTKHAQSEILLERPIAVMSHIYSKYLFDYQDHILFQH